MVLKRLVAIFVSLFLFHSIQFAKKPVAEFHIKKTSKKIKIDGYINDDAWKDALIIPVNVEILPGENISAPVHTTCLMIYDEHTLYIAFKAFDPRPSNIRAHLSDRDNAWDDDQVAIFLDTFNDKNRAFAFFSNPLGVQMDEIFSDGGNSENDSWDAIWSSAGHINETGYEVEMAIPFRALQFQHSPNPQTWGFSPLRIYPRSQRHQMVNFALNRSNSCLLCQFTKLKGVTGVTPGKNIELDPTITAFRTDERIDFPDGEMEKKDSKIDLGISGHWGFTSNLTLSATINPDFSQVEADAGQLDLNTQFALYYPEKRPFFLEGNDFFSTRINAVHTRTLADPSWGVKISGKEKKNALGVFIARDEITNLLFPGSESSDTETLDQGNTSSVIRYRRDLGSSSTIGFLVTDREGNDYYNRLGGVDGLVRVSKSDTFMFQVLHSATRYPGDIADQYNQGSDELTGYGMNFSYRRETRDYNLKAIYVDFSPGFRADLGFVPQVNYRKAIVGGGYTFWGKKNAFFSRIQLNSDLDQSFDHQGNLMEREAEISLELEMPLQSYLNIGGGVRKKVFNETPFNQSFLSGFFSTRPNGQLTFECLAAVQDDIDFKHTRPGTFVYFEPNVTYRIGKHLFTRLSYLYARLKIDDGELFRAHIVQGQLMYHFNKRMFMRGILQYTNINQNIQLYEDPTVEPEYKWLFTQFLFSYKLNPRTVLFLGYSDNHIGYYDVGTKQLDRTFFFKIGYALSL
jgi:Domain of unknown function (DUF5916)/Carbohydrate family 9 binding domain-like